MKVNTDGVLLGAWADVGYAKNILDIGTGTGVIALMMAQKNPAAQIDAIDIDHDAWLQATENFDLYGTHRLKACHTSLQNFEPGIHYDAIISNPPYFIDDYKTESHQKNIAKHSIALSYAHLLSGIAKLLNDTGKAFIVLPAFNLAPFEKEAAPHLLYITVVTEVIAVEGKPPYLALLQLERAAKDFSKTTITIQDPGGNFTEQYKELTKDFYLKF